MATEATQVGRAEDVDQEQAEGHRWGVEKYKSELLTPQLSK